MRLKHTGWGRVARARLICHVAPLATPPRFVCLCNFLTQFLRQLLGAFWYSKWVMHGAVGKLEKSNFQRYKVCTNRSLDGKVMALRSRGIRAVFLCFFGEDSGQIKDVSGELRVTRSSRGYPLS